MGFHPCRFSSPQNVIPHEQGIRYHRSKRRGGMGGQVRFIPSSYKCFVFHIIVNGIQQSQKIVLPTIPCTSVNPGIPRKLAQGTKK